MNLDVLYSPRTPAMEIAIYDLLLENEFADITSSIPWQLSDFYKRSFFDGEIRSTSRFVSLSRCGRLDSSVVGDIKLSDLTNSLY
jgi:hypothetical protein